uniref:Secreted protein n=1 Tax=Macrostomum lignano TaxID=282301 RepID=A0A1I8JN87_9PLAT
MLAVVRLRLLCKLSIRCSILKLMSSKCLARALTLRCNIKTTHRCTRHLLVAGLLTILRLGWSEIQRPLQNGAGHRLRALRRRAG